MHRMRDETRNGGRMEQPTLCSPDRICQGDSELQVVLQQLIEAHGIPAVKQVLRRIEAANQVETTRSRGRPPGPAIDDLPALQKAAAIWRQQGCGPVWPALTAVAKSLRGEPESNARRLFSRLLETGLGWGEEFERAGIDDFSQAARDRKVMRTLVRDARYTIAFFRTMRELFPEDPKLADLIESTGNMFRGFITMEDVAILIQPSIAKIIPFHLIHLRNEFYLLYFGRIVFNQPIRCPIRSEHPITFEDLIIANSCRFVDVKISRDFGPAKTIFFDILPFDSFSYLIPRQTVT